MELKILSWNIWYDGNFEEAAIFFQASNFDIICLQEVALGDETRNAISYLKKLGYEYVFCPVFKNKYDGRTIGNAIFSKFKILTSKEYELSEADNSRKIIRADIQIKDRIFHIFSVHLTHTHQQPSGLQEAQAEKLIKIVPINNSIVMGDFNATPESQTIKIISKVLINTDPDFIPTWSVYPEGCHTCMPKEINIHLDYIFTTQDIKTSGFEVGVSKASDHLPISVLIQK